jgi:hypothetical protein
MECPKEWLYDADTAWHAIDQPRCHPGKRRIPWPLTLSPCTVHMSKRSESDVESCNTRNRFGNDSGEPSHEDSEIREDQAVDLSRLLIK